MSSPITFYDLRFKNGLPSSPNTWKTRFTLNYKGIPYKTTYINFIDIKPTLQAANIPPSEGDAYTVPAIIDPSTGQNISDSARIAAYLDAQYPDTPSVLPPNTREAQMGFMKSVGQPLAFALFPLILMDIFNAVEDKDKEYFRCTREARFGGAPLEAVVAQGEKRQAQLVAVKAGLDNAEKEIAKHSGEGALFFGGDVPCFADMSLAAVFYSLLKASGPEHEVNKVILAHEWAAKYIKAFEKWASIET